MDEERVELEEDKANLAEEKALCMKIAEKLETMQGMARLVENAGALQGLERVMQIQEELRRRQLERDEQHVAQVQVLLGQTFMRMEEFLQNALAHGGSGAVLQRSLETSEKMEVSMKKIARTLATMESWLERTYGEIARTLTTMESALELTSGENGQSGENDRSEAS